MQTNHHFLSPIPMRRIVQLAAKSKGIVAVPFLGKNASTILPLLPGSVLITRLTKTDVEQGLVSPAEVIQYLGQGVEVHSCSNLHAKVYVFGKRAVIGSANVSNSSLSLVEAAVESSDEGLVGQARQFVEALRAEPVTVEFATSLLRFYRTDRVGGWTEDQAAASGPVGGKTKARHSRMWVMSLVDRDWSEEVEAAADVGRPTAKSRIEDPARLGLTEIGWESKTWAKLAVGDRVVQRFARGRGYVFDAPAKIVHIEPSTDASSAAVFLAQRKRAKSLSSTLVRAELGELAAHFRKPTEQLHAVASAEACAAFERLWPVSAPRK